MDILQSEQNDNLIRRFSYRLAVILLLCHISFAFWYLKEGMNDLFLYNLFSIAVFVLDFVLIRTGRIVLMSILNYAEISVFMTLNTLLLGWEYGFQYYAFGLLVSAFLVQMQLSERRKVRPVVVVYACVIAADFIIMRVWLMHHESFYPFLPIAGIMYLVNAALVLSMLISFTLSLLHTTSTLEEELIFVAGHDVLTKLPNRRTVDQSIMNRKPAWIAIMDLDKFKEVNDRYGHEAGDEVLRAVGKTLSSFAGETGTTAGRYGGEEFFLYGDTSNDSIQGLLESLRGRIEQTQIVYGGNTIHITATFGVAAECGDVETMLRTADARLYEGKVNGRNRVVF